MSRVIAPKIRVHYIKPVQHRHIQPKRWWVSAWFLVTLIIGLSSGAYLSWSREFGQADIEPDTAAETTTSNPVIPLQFDQSELDVVADLLPLLIEENRHVPSLEEIAANARKDALRDYLSYHKSPLAKDDAALDALLRSKNMKMMLAISFVESNMCRKHYYHNCSGIGGSNIRQYPGFAGWVDDFDNLLERKYKGLAVEDFLGYYVQPGTQNWADGVHQILDELKKYHIE